VMIPFGPFEPDKSPYNGTSSDSVLNCFPVADGWGPMPGLTIVSQALPSECRGACYVRDTSGNYTIIAGTTTAMYKLNTTDFSWDDISGPSAPYHLNLLDTWTFTVFGTRLVIHNISDPIQVYEIDSGGDLTDLAGTPPQAKYSWVSGDFLVLGYLANSNGEKMIRWSGYNDITSWTIGTKGADEQTLPEGNEVQGGFGQQAGFYVINRGAMHYFAFAPSSGYTFTRTTINPNQGAVSARSIIPIGQDRFFYLSEDGFFEGVNRKPIGAERVDRWFISQIDMTYLADVQGASDPYEKMVWWKFRRIDGSFRRLGYDWQLDRWCSSDLDVGEMMALATPGVTWDGLDEYYASIAEALAPFDDRTFLGGRPTMATFTTDNKLAFFSGLSLQASLDTSQVQPGGMSRAFCNAARVMTDATDFSLIDTTYAFHGADGSISAASSINRAGLVPLRSDGRLHKFSMTIPESTTWSIVSAIDANFVPSGQS
jgi:hypothetical protein